MLIVTGIMNVAPSDLEAFLADLHSLALATRQRPGNIAYDAAVEDAPAGRLLIAERWADQAALTAHLKADDTKAFGQRWQGRMWGDIRKYDASNERALTDN
ncbi:putative quinol monooxygenase [Martelella endophytica]|uniref:Antibiotic biosynthesis monooxygenase n=1 Tax=Martelella endophytica TaxID=1486262 RepID=A0A0D5LRI4_MAREN|nr:putative quinol monooxygenase [Martelella endophytica]AJY46545.1 antibiotic biosynthesis monooxygenase [Martelella endophytica]